MIITPLLLLFEPQFYVFRLYLQVIVAVKSIFARFQSLFAYNRKLLTRFVVRSIIDFPLFALILQTYVLNLDQYNVILILSFVQYELCGCILQFLLCFIVIYWRMCVEGGERTGVGGEIGRGGSSFLYLTNLLIISHCRVMFTFLIDLYLLDYVMKKCPLIL